MRLANLRGQRFGRLLVGERAQNQGAIPTKPGGYTAWHCRCDCGASVTALASRLKNGMTRSCGCLAKEVALTAHRTHGQSSSPTYSIWAGMRKRCTDENCRDYPKYGGRGIAVCERWQNFANFIADMGPRPSPEHSIDRIDNDRGYEPENCRWATRSQQNLNRRPFTRRNRATEHAT